MMHRSRIIHMFEFAFALCFTAMIAGCPPRVIEPGPVLPARQAVSHVNQNSERIDDTVRAIGYVNGYFTDERGGRRSFDLDAVLLYHPQGHVRLELESLVGTEVLVGCNSKHFWWFNQRQDNTLYVRPLSYLDDLGSRVMLVRPDQMVEALGLTPIEGFGMTPERVRDGTFGAKERPIAVQRVDGAYQQVLFIQRDEFGVPLLTKEYWLDRRDPRLVSRVIFRDRDGVVIMDATLANYEPLETDGPLIAHEIMADWPESGSRLTFHIKQWKAFPRVSADGPPFRPPHKLGIRYDNEDIIE